MKKNIFKFMMMAIAALFLSVGFTACSSDDDDNNNGNTPGASEAVTGQLRLNFTVTEDLFNVADIKVTYSDETGKDVTETLSSAEFNKTVTYTQLPVTSKYSIKATLKDNYPPKSTYKFGINYSYSFRKLKGEKVIENSGDSKGGNIGGIKAENLNAAIKDFNRNHFPQKEYQFTK